MTHVNNLPSVGNRYRVAGPFVEQNLGLSEIDWAAIWRPVLRLKALNVDGAGGLHFQIELGALKK